MALALPFLQAVLKTYLIPKAPLLNFMCALAYGLASAGVVIIATFVGWLLSDKSRSFSVMVPALCARMQLKSVRPLAVPRTWRESSKPPRCVACPHFLRTLMSRPLHVSAPPLRGLLLPLRVAGASSLLASPCSSAARTKKPGAALPRSFCRLRCVFVLSGVNIARSLLVRVLPQVLTSLLCSWTAAQIGPVQMRLADALQVFCGAGLASTGIITCAVLGWERLSTHPVLLEALADGKSGGASVSLLRRARRAAAVADAQLRRLASGAHGVVPRRAVHVVPVAQVCAACLLQALPSAVDTSRIAAG